MSVGALAPALPPVFTALNEHAATGSTASADAKSQASSNGDHVNELRAQLLLGLDLFVRAERALRVESSSFTSSLGRVPNVLGALTHFYRVDIARATRNRLLVVATGEGRRSVLNDLASIVGDRVTIDEEFRVHTNFPLPSPPRDYLHTLARTVMNRIHSSQFQLPERSDLDRWEGVFHGYFRYEVRPVSDGGRTIVALGLSGPVRGDIVEMQSGANIFEWVYNHRNGASAAIELQGSLEEIYLAQRIYQDHVGHYAPNFKGLVSASTVLAALDAPSAPLALQEFQLDPTFGFLAEIGVRGRSAADADSEGRSPASLHAWSVNGYGQVAQVDTVERLVDQFEQARKQVATHGDSVQSLGSPWPGEPDASPALSELKSDSAQGRKPLLIEALEGDR